MRVTGWMLILGLLVSGCGLLGHRDGPRISARPDSTGTCEKLLAKKDAEALIGTDLGDPQTISMNNLSLCGWIQTDNQGRLAAGSIEATEWVKNVPSALELIKKQYADQLKLKPERLRILERRLAQGLPSTNSGACAMFRDLIALQYPNLEKGSDSVVSYVPDRAHATAVTAQSCSGGEFRTITWLKDSGLDPTDDLADKFLKAVVALDTDSVHG